MGYYTHLNRNEVITRDEVMANLARFTRFHAKIIYYHHGTHELKSIHLNDDTIYRNEMKILRRGYREGEIAAIYKDETIQIDGKKYHPILFQIIGASCPPWSIIKGEWWMDHMHWTPYLFRSRELRDLCYEYLTKPRIPEVDWVIIYCTTVVAAIHRGDKIHQIGS